MMLSPYIYLSACLDKSVHKPTKFSITRFVMDITSLLTYITKLVMYVRRLVTKTFSLYLRISSGISGIAPCCVHTYALTCTANL